MASAPTQASAPIPEPLFLLGAGRVATALARLLGRSGLDVAGLWTRSAGTAERARAATGLPCASGPLPAAIARAGLLIVAVHDEATPQLARQLAARTLAARAVLHCGGGQSAAQALAALPRTLPRGTFHPLVAISGAAQGERLIPGATLALEGDPPAIAIGEALAARIGASVLRLSAEQMALYHAAAVIASNHAVALWHDAALLLERIGVEHAAGALLPLLRSTLENVAALGLPEALTGPARRGDAATVARHLDELRRHAPELSELYRQASLAAVRAAEACADRPDAQALARLRAVLAAVDGDGAGGV